MKELDRDQWLLPWNESHLDDSCVYKVLCEQERARASYVKTSIVLWLNRWMGYPSHRSVYGVGWIESHCNDYQEIGDEI